MQIAIFVFAVFGLVEIIIRGKPTAPLRKLFSIWGCGKEFIHCPLCLGFWCGAVLGHFLMPLYIFWGVCWMFNGFIGAGMSYFLHTIVTPPVFDD